MSRVTLQTVADAASVSKMTVSNAFAHPERLSPDLLQRILLVADELGYAGPDASARALARGRTGVVGVLLTDAPEDAFSDEVAVTFVGAMARALRPRSLSMVLLSGATQGDLVPARDVAMDGVVVYSGSRDTSSIDWLLSRRLPVVMVDRTRRPGISSVGVENTDGAGEAADHVLSLGHRDIAILTTWVDAPHGVPAREARRLDGQHRERLEGWTQVLAREGVEPEVVGLPREMTRRECADLARGLLSRDDRPTAVLCFSDHLAAGVLDAAAELGLAVPRDLTVVGFDDSPLAATTTPPLTTVRQDLLAKGGTAVRLLLAAMDADHEGRKHRPRHHLVPTELVVRGSSGPVSPRRRRSHRG